VSAVLEQKRLFRRTLPLWLLPVQAVSVFTALAIAAGGNMLRGWLLAALVWLMSLPLLVSLEASLVAMMFFEPLRGIIRRGQYLFIEYTSQDPIHVLTPVVTIFALVSLLRSRRLNILIATPLAACVSILGAIYLLEIFNPLQGGVVVGLSGAMFSLVPLVWFYFGQYVEAAFITKVLKLLIVVGLVTSLYGVYQLVFGYPSFEQYWINNTEFYSSIALGHVERALATFSSAEEWGRYTELGAIAAFGFAGAQTRLAKRVGWLLAGIGLTGFVALTGQRAAMFGLVLGLLVLMVLGARTFAKAILRVTALLLPMALLFVLVQAPTADDMWSGDDSQKVSTVLSHTQRGMLKPAGEESFQERVTNWTFLLTEVIPFRPLGAGIGAGSLSEWRFSGNADELPPIDSSILYHGITCGIAGLLLFVWILSRATWFSVKLARRAEPDGGISTHKRIVAAIMFALVLNSVFGLTFTLYSIAPLAWLFIGWLSAETLKARREENEREVFTI
jgi:hypothetical protein